MWNIVGSSVCWVLQESWYHLLTLFHHLTEDPPGHRRHSLTYRPSRVFINDDLLQSKVGHRPAYIIHAPRRHVLYYSFLKFRRAIQGSFEISSGKFRQQFPSISWLLYPHHLFFLNHINLKIKIKCKIKKKTGRGEGCAETGDCSHIYALLPRLYNRSI